MRLFKVELQKLPTKPATLQVCHYPPTSKWNKIEHRLFCHITENCVHAADEPPAAVELIASTTTKTAYGAVRTRHADLPKGIKVSEEEMASLNIKGDAFHPEWNYTISPRVPP